MAAATAKYKQNNTFTALLNYYSLGPNQSNQMDGAASNLYFRLINEEPGQVLSRQNKKTGLKDVFLKVYPVDDKSHSIDTPLSLLGRMHPVLREAFERNVWWHIALGSLSEDCQPEDYIGDGSLRFESKEEAGRIVEYTVTHLGGRPWPLVLVPRVQMVLAHVFPHFGILTQDIRDPIQNAFKGLNAPFQVLQRALHVSVLHIKDINGFNLTCPGLSASQINKRKTLLKNAVVMVLPNLIMCQQKKGGLKICSQEEFAAEPAELSEKVVRGAHAPPPRKKQTLGELFQVYNGDSEAFLAEVGRRSLEVDVQEPAHVVGENDGKEEN
jgi:hypothetical protein